MSADQTILDNAGFYRRAYYDEHEKLAKLVKAADDLHRVTVSDFGHRNEWQTLGGVLNEVAPTTFDRVTGDPASSREQN